MKAAAAAATEKHDEVAKDSHELLKDAENKKQKKAIHNMKKSARVQKKSKGEKEDLEAHNKAIEDAKKNMSSPTPE